MPHAGRELVFEGLLSHPSFVETSSMKLCPYCSAEMGDAGAVCPHCGRDWNSGPSTVPPVQPVESPRTSSDETWRLWGLVAIILVLAPFAYCAVMVQRVMH